MSLEDFWHGDMRLLAAAQKAYFRDKSYSSWLNGQYSFVAHQYAIRNAMRTKTSEKYLDYPEWTDPLVQKSEVRKETQEQQFRSNMRRITEQLKRFR